MDSRVESCGDSTPHRTIWTIVRTGIATMFACTWVAVHPNIPGPKHGQLRILRTRIGIMFMVLIAPEMVITWATRQYFAAWEIQKALGDQPESQNEPRSWYRRIGRFLVDCLYSFISWVASYFNEESKVDSRKWTIVHSFFLLMGGFVVPDERNDSVKTLDMENMARLKEKRMIRWPPVAETDLTDRRKGDFFSKGVIIVQITWFMVQCIVRVQQRLTLTQLELATLAYAPLTLALYILWWDKPLGVRYPIVVELIQDGRNQLKLDEVIETIQLPREHKPPTPKPSHFIPPRLEEKLHKNWSKLGFWQKATAGVTFILLSLLVSPLLVLGLVEWAIIILGIMVWTIIRPVVSMSTEIAPEGDRVPTFYAPNIKSNFRSMYCNYICPALVGLIFGIIHAFAWFASFPTTFEKWAWRAATITIATFFGWRICSFLLKLFKDVSEKRICGVHFGSLPEFLGALLNVCFGVFIWTVFVPARIALLVLPFTSLRALPAGAFQDIDWVSFLPHI